MLHASEFSWREVPFGRLVLLLGAGIFVGYEWIPGEAVPIQLSGGVLLVLLFLGLLAYSRSLRPNANLALGGILLIWVLALGIWRVHSHHQYNDSQHFSHQSWFQEDSLLLWQGVVTDRRVSGERTRLEVAVTASCPQRATTSPAKGKLLLYMDAATMRSLPVPGQYIQFAAAARVISPALTPDAFDFAAFQRKRNVFHQASVADDQWVLLPDKRYLPWLAWQSRERLLRILQTWLPTGSNELAVASALRLGKRDELSAEVRNAYSETGAVHVLAVSGLHLGFIAWGLGRLLSLGPLYQRRFRWLRFFLTLVGIWAFALLTGMAPSVMRAATMFSFVLLGQTIGRTISIYNSLAASAFLLLMIDPFLLFDVGFQLSYLALLGIVFFQPRIYKLIFVPNRVLNYVWNLTSVGVAAQLATFPISIYYFHQFPLYFMLSGVVVVVAASFILGLGIFLFLTHWWPLLAGGVSFILHGIIWLNNAFIFQIQQLPGHLLTGIWITDGMLVGLYLALLFLAIYLVWPKAKWMMVGLASLVVVFALQLTQSREQHQQKRIVIYHQYKQSVIDVFDGGLRHSISTLPENDPALAFGVQPHRQKSKSQVDSLRKPHWYDQHPFVYGFYHHRIAILDREFFKNTPRQPIAVDIALVTQSPYKDLAEMSHHVQANVWVFDGSNFPGRVEAWRVEAKTLGIPTHWTAKEGAFRKDF
ncbi:MAG: ComEC/Rec2 family competence protein [Saprospiraceae bacterium]